MIDSFNQLKLNLWLWIIMKNNANPKKFVTRISDKLFIGVIISVLIFRNTTAIYSNMIIILLLCGYVMS